MKHFILTALISVAVAAPAPAQKLVDPANVAPEFREAAEKRRAGRSGSGLRAEANAEKILPREPTAF
jgi:hypothetical protein